MYVSDTLYSSLTQLELSRSRGKERKKEARLTLGRALGKKVRKDTDGRRCKEEKSARGKMDRGEKKENYTKF